MKWNKLFATALSLLVGAGLLFSSPSDKVEIVEAETVAFDVNVYYFTTPGCGHCAALKDYLNDKQDTMSNLTLTEFDISEAQYLSLLEETAYVFSESNVAVPFTVIGGKHYVGFNETIKASIGRLLIRYSQQEQIDIMAKIMADEPVLATDFDTTSDFEYELPLIGTVDVRDVSLGLIAIALGFLDGINPCAMWVLLFLISLVLGSHDKKRIWAIGGVFLLTSGVFYFIMMMAWLQTIQLLIAKVYFQIIIGIFALLAGAYNLYSFTKAQIKKEDGCEVTSVTTKQKIAARVKKIAAISSLPLALLGVAGLAIIVNAIELACSTGLPLVFTQILALNGYVGVASIGYILLYILFFLIDDLLIFGIAVVTLKVSPLSTKLGKYAHLIGGIIMALIGLLMIFAPQILMFSFF
jgi:glutaredoxin